MVFIEKIHILNHYNCGMFKEGCPNTSYYSDELYKCTYYCNLYTEYNMPQVKLLFHLRRLFTRYTYYIYLNIKLCFNHFLRMWSLVKWIYCRTLCILFHAQKYFWSTHYRPTCRMSIQKLHTLLSSILLIHVLLSYQ